MRVAAYRKLPTYVRKENVYCAMDFDHKLFDTNKDTTPANNLPRLICICANNHLRIPHYRCRTKILNFEIVFNNGKYCQEVSNTTEVRTQY